LVPVLAVILGGQADVTALPSASGFGHLSAVAAGDVAAPPAQVVIETGASGIDALDGPLVDAVRDSIRRALIDRGISVADTGSPILRFTVRSAPQASLPEAGDKTTTPGLPSIGTDRPTDIHDRVHDQVTVPADRGRGLLTSHFAISFLLFVPGQDPKWNATIEASGNVEDPTALLRRMTRAAMDAFGASVERDFVLTCTDLTDRQRGLCLP
jgi:hypothetical protein